MTTQARAPALVVPPAGPHPALRWALAVTVAVAAGLVALSVAAYLNLPPAMRRGRTPQAFAPAGLRWVQAFTWWDGAWYAGIASKGYSFTLGRREQLPVVFFPVYPLLVRWLTPLAGHTVLAGFLVSLVSGIGACVLFFRWCTERMRPAAARLSLACLLLYPGSFFLFGPLYADALFLLLAVAAFLLLDRDRPLAAALAAAVASATRPTGLVLVLALWVRALERRGGLGEQGRRRLDLGALRRRDAYLLLAPAGVAAYSVFLAARFGNPLLFLEAERGWHQSPGWRTWLKFAWFRGMNRRPWFDPHHFHLMGHLAVAIVAAILVVFVIRRFGLGYGLYAAGVVGLSALSTKDFVGLGRYVLAAFPCFAVAGVLLADRPRARVAALVGSGALLVFLTQLHARNMLIS